MVVVGPLRWKSIVSRGRQRTRVASESYSARADDSSAQSIIHYKSDTLVPYSNQSRPHYSLDRSDRFSERAIVAIGGDEG